MRKKNPQSLLIPAALLILGALAVRLQGINRSLWQDECWVANSVLSNTWRGMLYYDAWSQSTPPLFTSLIRVVISVTGPSDLAFKVLPLAFSMIAVVLFIIYSHKAFGGRLGLFCAAAFAFSQSFCAYSQELKQYSADLAIAVWILLILWRYADQESVSLYRSLVLTFVIAPFLSYTAILYIPLALIIIIMNPCSRKRAGRFVTSAGGAVAVCYLMFIYPNSTVNLKRFYEFPNFTSPATVISYYLRNSARLLGLLLQLPESLQKASLAMFLVAGAVAITGSVYPRRELRRCRLLVFSLVPLLTLIAANAAKQYPFGVPRVDLFILPSLVVVLTLATEIVFDNLGNRLPRRRFAPESSSHSLIVTGGLIVVLSISCCYLMRRRGLSMWEDAKSGVRYVVEHGGTSDLIYVHASASEQFKLYTKIFGSPTAPVSLGDTGWVCCPRDKDLALTNNNAAYMIQDFDAKVPRGIHKTVWLIYTGRWDHWARNLGRDEPAFMRKRLVDQGCGPGVSPLFHNFVVDRFSCR